MTVRYRLIILRALDLGAGAFSSCPVAVIRGCETDAKRHELVGFGPDTRRAYFRGGQ